MQKLTGLGIGLWVLICFLFSLFVSSSVLALEVRQVDGSGNNVTDPLKGAAGSPLLRLLPAAYDDGLSVPRGATGSTLPGARTVSNTLGAQLTSIPSAKAVNGWFWQWGQFLDHDLDLTGPASPLESFNIAVPTGDLFFDPQGEGDKQIPLLRSNFVLDDAGTRQQVNQITAFIDGSNVYGSDAVRMADLRTNDGTGKLRTATAANGEIILPFNINGLDNAMPGPGAAADLFIAGDVRANEQLGLTATHTLFMREHNRLADKLKTMLDNREPSLVAMLNAALTDLTDGIDDLGDFIYQAVRKVVGAQIQKITYEEFIPVLLGPDALPVYRGYDEEVDPGISNEFSTAAFRVGHSMLPTELWRSPDLDLSSVTRIALRDSFFNPQEIVNNGIDSLLAGLLLQPAQEVDTKIVDDVRNFLIGPPGLSSFFDLASLNIQRGRDHGLASYNDYRQLFGSGPATDFAEITGGDQDLAALFDSIYTLDDVDLWMAGIAESHVNGGMVGEVFWHILVDQFSRLRDGDRFSYLNEEEMNQILMIDPLFEQHSTLNALIELNTHYEGMPESMFLLQAQIAEPGVLALFLLGLVALLIKNGLICKKIITTVGLAANSKPLKPLMAEDGPARLIHQHL